MEQKNITDKVVGTYKKIETAVVNSYQKLEDTVVHSYTEVEDAFVSRYLIHDGETLADAKARLKQQNEKKNG